MSKNKKVISVSQYLRKKRLIEQAKAWEKALPPASKRYQNLIFLYPEDLATHDREMLFSRINTAAETNRQTLVISDCHYSRSGLYVLYDEIGGRADAPVDIDEIIENWCELDQL